MICRCGHDKLWHEHYRRGTDCGYCGAVACPRYRGPSWWQRLLGRTRP